MRESRTRWRRRLLGLEENQNFFEGEYLGHHVTVSAAVGSDISGAGRPPRAAPAFFPGAGSGYPVIPIFALANAGVDVRGGCWGTALSQQLTWAVIAGLSSTRSSALPGVAHLVR